MRLAKQHLDIGLFTNDIAAHAEFWGDTVDLRLDHQLELREGWVQHRYDAHGSVIKVNHYAAPLASYPPSGYRALTIARAGQPAWEGRHPGGEHVRLVPPGTDGVVGIASRTTSRSGTYCRATFCCSRKATIPAKSIDWPAFGTTIAQARSPSRSSA